MAPSRRKQEQFPTRVEGVLIQRKTAPVGKPGRYPFATESADDILAGLNELEKVPSWFEKARLPRIVYFTQTSTRRFFSRLYSVSFCSAACRVKEVAGSNPAGPTTANSDKHKALRTLWKLIGHFESPPVTE